MKNIVQSKLNKYYSYLILICLFYSIIHNLFSFSFVFIADYIFSFENVYLNLFLLGWKESALLLIVSIICIIHPNKNNLIFILLVSFAFVFLSLRFIKEIILPFLILYFLQKNIK